MEEKRSAGFLLKAFLGFMMIYAVVGLVWRVICFLPPLDGCCTPMIVFWLSLIVLIVLAYFSKE